MLRRLALILLLMTAIPAAAQQPTPLYNATPLPPPAASAPPAASPALATPAPTPAPAPSLTQSGRIFCEQSISAQPVDPASVPPDYRPFIGVFSDADWNPQTCAALIVENVAADGTAAITYVFGPLGSGSKTPSGVLHGTGIVKDGSLLFQNNDGSQYAFKPFYADLAGRWTTAKGQTYEAIFKRTY
jgi:hypothetical protein